MAKESKKNVTAWLDDEQMRKLQFIMDRMGGNPSNSYALSKLIEAEYDRLTGKADEVPFGSNDEVDDIYKALVLISQGLYFSDVESLKRFLKEGK